MKNNYIKLIDILLHISINLLAFYHEWRSLSDCLRTLLTIYSVVDGE